MRSELVFPSQTTLYVKYWSARTTVIDAPSKSQHFMRPPYYRISVHGACDGSFSPRNEVEIAQFEGLAEAELKEELNKHGIQIEEPSMNKLYH